MAFEIEVWYYRYLIKGGMHMKETKYSKYDLQLIKKPNTWKELESIVAHILSYCGYATEIAKTISTARGESEIDVYAESKDKYKLVCISECKFWNKRVNQDVVDSFRTRMLDIGANIGFIISKKGFQSGCYEKAKKTNIKLLSF